MAVIGEMRQLTIGGKTYTLPTYTLPIASSSTLGGIKVGSGLSIDPSTGTLTATGTSITIDTAMSDSSTNAVQNKVIKSYADGLIAALDGGTIGTPGAGKTLTAFSQTNGQVSATFSNISITKSQVSDFPTKVSAFTNDAGYITNAGVTGVKGNSESSYRTGQVNLTAANVGAVATSGNETVAGNKTFSGTTTLSAGSVYPASQNTIIVPNAGAIIQSPIPKYLWHDVLAFCRATTPTYYTTTNGSTWTESTLEKRLFAHMNSWGNQQIINSNISGSRWVWHGGGFAYSSIAWIVLGITYNATVATFDLLLETTSDATAASPTWTTLCTVTGAKYNQQPIWIKTSGPSTNDFRLTITRSSGDDTTTVLPLCAIEFLTTRWGDQGKGDEFEFPYRWDGIPNIYPLQNNTSTLGTSSYKWSNVYATTFTGNLTGNVTGNVTGTATGNLTSVQYDSTNAKLTYTKNGSNTDIVTVATLKSALGSMPASDVYNWAKASSKPTYTASEVGALPSTTVIPTKVSELTNDSGYITSYTDEKLKWTASTSSNTYYPLQSTSTATTSTANTLNSVSFYQYYNTAGGYRRLILGNTTAYTSSGGAYGTIRLYGTGATYYGDLNPGTIGANSLTANRTWTLPNATGTIALTSQIPTVPTNVSAFTNDAGYLTSYTETDPTVPSWAKASSKPSYTFSEIGSKPTTISGYGITNAYTKTEVDTLISNLPEPMIFKGSLGTGGTITSLPTAAAANEGFTYKVITAGTYASQSAKVGDTFISDGSAWVLIPSGDEPSGTVTSITLTQGSGITISNSGTAITTSGTRTISHGDTSSQASSSNSGRTYIQSITLDDYGHVTGLSTATETVTNTDTKLQVAAVTSGTTYYPIVGTGTTAATRQYDTTGFIYVGTNGTTSAVGSAKLTLGNSTASGTANNKQGQLVLYGSTAYAHTISGAPTAARTLTLPDKTGTIALTSDIPTVNYPVTSVNSKTGAVSLTASDVGALASSTTYVSTVTTTAGTHTTISSKSGAVSFNVPTKTSHLTNDSGFTTNTGTVTSVAAAGATNSGITISGSPITTSGTITVGLNLSTAINGLGEGTSPAQLNDYAVVQYAGGGTTTTTYHRRKLSNLIVGKAVADQNGATIDTTYLKLAGGTVTGPVTFGDAVSIDEATIGDLVVNGNGSFTNNLQVNTINGVAVTKIFTQASAPTSGMSAGDIWVDTSNLS